MVFPLPKTLVSTLAKNMVENPGNMFSEVVFPNCWPLALHVAIFDLKFGFYVNFPPRNRLKRSRIRNPGPTKRINRNVIGLTGLLKGLLEVYLNECLTPFNVVVCVFCCFFLRPGSTVHCIYCCTLRQNPGQNPSQKHVQ